MAFTKKTSASSDQILVGAATNFKKALNELEGGFAAIKGLGDQVETLQATIASKEDNIKQLDVDYTEKKRQAEVDLSLTIKANQANAVDAILLSQNKVAIDKNEYNKIQTSLTTLQSDFDKKISEETSKAYGKINSEFKQKEALLESEFARKEADNKARIGSLETLNESLREQVNMLRMMLDNEREASIKRAQAQGSVNLTVPTSGK